VGGRETKGSAIGVQHVLENFGIQILRNKLNGRLPLKFTGMKFEELLGEKRWEALLFHKTVTTHMSSFLTSFFADVSCLHGQ